MFALIDVNGMYASCEQAFRPDLANRAVAVLSNNDGNIVARNYLYVEFKIKLLVLMDNGSCKSSNIRVGIFWDVD